MGFPSNWLAMLGLGLWQGCILAFLSYFVGFSHLPDVFVGFFQRKLFPLVAVDLVRPWEKVS